MLSDKVNKCINDERLFCMSRKDTLCFGGLVLLTFKCRCYKTWVQLHRAHSKSSKKGNNSELGNQVASISWLVCHNFGDSEEGVACMLFRPMMQME